MKLQDTHGKRACYLNGCRCDLCREANIDYMAAWRAQRPPRPPAADTADTLAAQCWCRRSVVDVARADILAGLTGPCDQTWCRGINTARRKGAA